MNLKSNKNNNQSSLIDNQLEMPSTIVERTLQIRPFFCKTNPIFRIFILKMKISLKNKPNSKPIQTQFWPKNQGGKAKQTQNKPNSTLNVSSPCLGVYPRVCLPVVLPGIKPNSFRGQ
jgi:hypothetical protein